MARVATLVRVQGDPRPERLRAGVTCVASNPLICTNFPASPDLFDVQGRCCLKPLAPELMCCSHLHFLSLVDQLETLTTSMRLVAEGPKKK